MLAFVTDVIHIELLSAVSRLAESVDVGHLWTDAIEHDMHSHVPLLVVHEVWILNVSLDHILFT